MTAEHPKTGGDDAFSNLIKKVVNIGAPKEVLKGTAEAAGMEGGGGAHTDKAHDDHAPAAGGDHRGP